MLLVRPSTSTTEMLADEMALGKADMPEGGCMAQSK